MRVIIIGPYQLFILPFDYVIYVFHIEFNAKDYIFDLTHLNTCTYCIILHARTLLGPF